MGDGLGGGLGSWGYGNLGVGDLFGGFLDMGLDFGVGGGVFLYGGLDFWGWFGIWGDWM